MISLTGSTALTFRYFGVAAAVFGLLYFLFEFGYVKGWRKMHLEVDEPKNKKYSTSPDERNIVVEAPLIDANNTSVIIPRKDNV